jgi:hypothetical protein
MQRSDLVTCCAIAGVVILEGIALLKGVDGTYLAMAVGALSFIFGWQIPSPWQKQNPKPPEVPNL